MRTDSAYYRNHWTVSTRKKNDRYHLNFGLAHVAIWSGQISHVTICSFRRQKNFASKWMLLEELSTVGNQLERILPKSLNWYHPFQLISHGGKFFRKHSLWSKVLLSAKRTSCHVTNLAAPNGHVSKPKIQMQSIVFFRVLTVLRHQVHEWWYLNIDTYNL